MAKKATTIILFFVVILLLGSTVYVSIILTSEDSAPQTTQTRASELEEELTIATEEAEPIIDPFAEDAAIDPLEEDPFAEAEEAQGDAVDSEVMDPTEGRALADASSTGEESDPFSEEEDLFATEDSLFETTNSPQTTEPEDLPETGLGQPTNTPTPPSSPTPTFAPTMLPSATPQRIEPTETNRLPTAGFGVGIGAAVVAGATIIASLVL